MALVHSSVDVHVQQSSKNENVFCGDSYFFKETKDYFICVLADGLGSGEYAYESSNAVITYVEENHAHSVDELMKESNKKMVHKRGAAVAILKVDFVEKTFEYSCVGNIRFYLYSPQGKLTYPLPVTGYLSGRPQKFKTQRFRYEDKSKFLMHSDGIQVMGIKALMNNRDNLLSISEDILELQTDISDDSTFIIGSLLS
ncbi:PP2C family serine/threonine-protein phosphatase [Bacillus sp. 2205SS5-2]|uniref:PP2C family serine/threonine-protein phosphatase n=1 Tax=Bacillus sp. 2205SS5-2 TaxID=3109031 RepID=UPI0030068957